MEIVEIWQNLKNATQIMIFISHYTWAENYKLPKRGLILIVLVAGENSVQGQRQDSLQASYSHSKTLLDVIDPKASDTRVQVGKSSKFQAWFYISDTQ